MRNHYTFFHSGCVILPSCQSCTRTPISLYYCQHLVFYSFPWVWVGSLTIFELCYLFRIFVIVLNLRSFICTLYFIPLLELWSINICYHLLVFLIHCLLTVSFDAQNLKFLIKLKLIYFFFFFWCYTISLVCLIFKKWLMYLTGFSSYLPIYIISLSLSYNTC